MTARHSTNRKGGRKPIWPPHIHLHRASGQARVTIGGKHHYLGRFGSAEVEVRYRQEVAKHQDAPTPALPLVVAAPRQRKERNAWASMKRRCHDPKAVGYSLYGGRGIWVCSRWRESFDAFLGDVGFAPSKAHSLDRINNEAGYCCGHCDDCVQRGVVFNCRWVTWDVQSRNKRNTRRLTYQGRTASLVEWSERTGVPSSTIAARLSRGMTVGEALKTPPGKHRVRAAVIPVEAVGLLSEFAWR